LPALPAQALRDDRFLPASARSSWRPGSANGRDGRSGWRRKCRARPLPSSWREAGAARRADGHLLCDQRRSAVAVGRGRRRGVGGAQRGRPWSWTPGTAACDRWFCEHPKFFERPWRSTKNTTQRARPVPRVASSSSAAARTPSVARHMTPQTRIDRARSGTKLGTGAMKRSAARRARRCVPGCEGAAVAVT
jgi:hypothetical protein